MITIYEQFARRWETVVRRFALDIWRGRDNKTTNVRYDKQARVFARQFRNALDRRYKAKGMRVWRGTLDGKANEWLQRQNAIKDVIRTSISDRKSELVEKEIERLKRDESLTVQESVNRIYALKKDENVYKVFSFSEHFQAKSEQIGDDEAFALGREMNEAAIQENRDRYIWMTQHDSKVRKTHRKLYKKCFLFSNPPTTVDADGRTHTGNPGTDWGCRCYADPAPPRMKPNLNYVVYEK